MTSAKMEARSGSVLRETTCSAHVNIAKHDYDRTKGAIGFVLVQIKLRLKCFYSS